jgi:DNA repair exonuclease SbcCD nuclease subunit
MHQASNLGACALAVALIGCDSDVIEPGGWSIVVLPDTQYYARSYPESFAAQTAWIRDQADALDLQFVLHAGDVTDDNSAAQWQVARDAFDAIEGDVPYVLAPGNHDLGDRGSTRTRDTLLHDYFPPSAAMAQRGVGGLFDPARLDNSWHLFETPDGPWLVLALEFGPREQVVAWADGVLAAHPDVPTILLTHAYLYSDDTRYDVETRPDQEWSPHDYGVRDLPGGVSDGEALYQALVRRHDQIDLVICGHVLNDGIGRLTSPQDGGGVVHELLADYQVRELGGEGYLRVLTFSADGVDVRTYSPVTGAYLDDVDNRFSLPLP